MFIMSSMKTKVTYSAHGHRIEIKPGINLIKEPITFKELRDCYGDRISLISDEVTKEHKKEGTTKTKKVEESKIVKVNAIIKTDNEETLHNVQNKIMDSLNKDNEVKGYDVTMNTLDETKKEENTSTENKENTSTENTKSNESKVGKVKEVKKATKATSGKKGRSKNK